MPTVSRGSRGISQQRSSAQPSPSASPPLSRSTSSGQRAFLQAPSYHHGSRQASSQQGHASSSSSSSVTPLCASSVRSSSPLQRQQSQQKQRPIAPLNQWEEAVPFPQVMSPLAQALQVQWRQLQQDMLSPSTLHLNRRQHTTAEEDVLRLLGSLCNEAEMAVEDAAHTVPYLLAFAVAPLPSLKTQVMALAALRGVLSSLPSVYGTEATNVFLSDIFLGEHQALQALSLCALVALESAHPEEHKTGAALSPSFLPASSVKPRHGHRSLLSRTDSTTASGATVRAISEPPDLHGSSRAGASVAAAYSDSSASATYDTPRPHGRESEEASRRSAELRSRIAHISLSLLKDAATLCGAVADALLSSDVLLKAALRLLIVSAATTAAIGAGGLPARQHNAALQCTIADVLGVLLTLLASEPTHYNEAALVLCSYDAPRAVCTLAQSLTYSAYDARGAVREAAGKRDHGVGSAAEVAENLLWASLKVLGWLTRGCPSGMKHYVTENHSIPAFLVQTLTIPVAEIREAAALWFAALLQTQPHTSLQLVEAVMDFTASTSSVVAVSSASVHATLPRVTELPVSAVGALVEMLRWRGAQMHVYGVSAILCWRWMLLSHPSRIAAVLHRDSSLLATLIELILRGSPSSRKAVTDGEDGGEANDTSILARDPAGHPLPSSFKAKEAVPSLPLRLIGLEAVHVFTLSFALGSLETRARLETQLVGGALSSTTLRRLREAAQALLHATHPAYYDDFPAMEVKLAEAELSEAMRRAGATVCTPSDTTTTTDKRAVPLNTAGSTSTSVVVRLTAGDQWRQLIAESLDDLTAGEAAPSPTLRGRSQPSGRAHRSGSKRAPASQQQQQHRQRLPFTAQLGGDVRASAQAAASAVAPIRVLGSGASRRDGAGGHTPTAEQEEKEGEHRVDINAVIAASLAEGQDNYNGNSSASRGALGPADAGPVLLLRVPRTIREATLVPTSQSTTTLRFGVVRQAESLGGLFVQDSMCTVLQLAQHYTSSKAAVGEVTPGISPQLVRAVQGSRRVSLLRGRVKVSHLDASYVDPSARLRSSSPSAVFGSAPRFGHDTQKERNPFAPVAKAAKSERTWTVQELRREDVLLFLTRYTHLMTELPEAIEAVEDHLYYLRRQLQLCPTRDVHRRCVLNDLYMNVYPNMHLFLRFILQQARQSRGVLQMLSSLNGGTVHSGNVLEAYDAVGQCTGLAVVE